MSSSTAHHSLRLPSRQAKGTFYFSWGYNRETYSKSTIHFHNTTTDNYDFTFIDAKARDEPDMDEFYKITHLTIPQYQMNAGYFSRNKAVGVLKCRGIT